MWNIKAYHDVFIEIAFRADEAVTARKIEWKEKSVSEGQSAAKSLQNQLIASVVWRIGKEHINMLSPRNSVRSTLTIIYAIQSVEDLEAAPEHANVTQPSLFGIRYVVMSWFGPNMHYFHYYCCRQVFVFIFAVVRNGCFNAIPHAVRSLYNSNNRF